jgi:metallo-beta-lactamase family protein
MDSMTLLAHDATKHNRPELYGKDDIEKALSLWEGIPYHQSREIGGGFSFELLDAGHILGSSMVKVSREGKCMIFTGDLGGGNSALLGPHDKVGEPDYLLMESVYGDRTREHDEDHTQQLMKIINETHDKGGVVLIPAFSTERTQDLIFEIRALMQDKKIPSMPVYIDSPLAEKITDAYLAYPQYFSKAIQERIAHGEKIFSFPELHMVENSEESRALAHREGPKIIIAGSGMSNGGRVHAHEQEILPQKNSTVVIVGYQAAGSLGRRLVEGDKNVYIMGQRVKVNAKIEVIYGYSAHMDSPQLLDFVSQAGSKLAQVFVVMGEPASSGFLAQRIRDYLGVKATAPAAKDEAIIEL